MLVLSSAHAQDFISQCFDEGASGSLCRQCLTTNAVCTAVNALVRQAVAAGGTTYNEPQDHGFMYGHGFQDLDGHIWDLVYMEPSAITRG